MSKATEQNTCTHIQTHTHTTHMYTHKWIWYDIINRFNGFYIHIACCLVCSMDKLCIHICGEWNEWWIDRWMDGLTDIKTYMIRCTIHFCESITIVYFVYRTKKGEKITRITTTTITSPIEATTVTTPMGNGAASYII